MPYARMHSRYELGNLVFYDAQYQHRWIDAIGPNAIVFKEDFAGDILDNWTGTAVAGTTGVSSYDAEGGAILLYTAGSDNDSYQLQKLEGFKAIDDCPIYFGVRWKITGSTGAASSGIVMGLCDEDTTVIAPPGDGIFFQNTSASTVLNLSLNTGGTDVDAAMLATILVDIWYVNEFYWDGVNTVKGYHNGVYTGSGSAASMDQTQTLAVTLAYMDDKGHPSGASGLVVDWVRAIQLLDTRNA